MWGQVIGVEGQGGGLLCFTLFWCVLLCFILFQCEDLDLDWFVSVGFGFIMGIARRNGSFGFYFYFNRWEKLTVRFSGKSKSGGFVTEVTGVQVDWKFAKRFRIWNTHAIQKLKGTVANAP